MVPFAKPGASENYDVMGADAARRALADAGIGYADVQQAYVGYVYGDSTCGQTALYGVGLTGIPIVNVNNNCSTGSSALWLARQAVATGGVADCVLALGFEQMRPGALVNVWDDRPSPPVAARRSRPPNAAVISPPRRWPPRRSVVPGVAYMEKYGIGPEIFGRVSVKARSHAARNPPWPCSGIRSTWTR